MKTELIYDNTFFLNNENLINDNSYNNENLINDNSFNNENLINDSIYNNENDYNKNNNRPDLYVVKNNINSSDNSNQRKKPHYRIYSKTRFCIFVITVLIILFSIFGLFLINDSASGMENLKYEVIEIEKGDTLWDIAADYVPVGTDIRDYIYEICDLNKMDSKEIYSGQTIKVPLHEE